jgi:hypothetical protein
VGPISRLAGLEGSAENPADRASDQAPGLDAMVRQRRWGGDMIGHIGHSASMKYAMANIDH